MDALESGSYIEEKPSSENGVADYPPPRPLSQKVNTSLSLTATNHNYNVAIHQKEMSLTDYGGRLQFFKDGKFILELTRSRDGEHGGWVSVPRKTFRAPLAATSAIVTPTSASTTYPKNESSASMSFSDDNSSVPSSPWQRDHIWKQPAPRRCISKEMSFYYYRPKNIQLTEVALQNALYKRRRPLDISKGTSSIFKSSANLCPNDSHPQTNLDLNSKNNTCNILQRGDIQKRAHCTAYSANVVFPKTSGDAETGLKAGSHTHSEQLKIKSTSNCKIVIIDGNMEVGESQHLKSKECLSAKGETHSALNITSKLYRKRLSDIVEKLIHDVPARLGLFSKNVMTSTAKNGAVQNLLIHKISPPSTIFGATLLTDLHQQHVSPRKRILREFEKVSLDDKVFNKKSRSKNIVRIASPIPPISCKEQIASANTLSSTLSIHTRVNTPVSTVRLNSSYSIQSILGESSNLVSTNKVDLPATITTNILQQNSNTLSPFYKEINMPSLISPDKYGVKEKRISTNHGSRRRSPHYAASPTHGADFSHRLSPDSYKINNSHMQHHLHQPYVTTPLMTTDAHRSSSRQQLISPAIGRLSEVSQATNNISPPRSHAKSPCSSPVPGRSLSKKAASVGREFLSPAMSNSCVGTTSPSPRARVQSPEKKTNTSQYPLLQSHPVATVLPTCTSTTVGSSFYYMYSSHTNGIPGHLNLSSSLNGQFAHQHAGDSAVAMAAAVAAAAYIPPSIYNPYLSTLAALRHPLLLHHYQNTAISVPVPALGQIPLSGANGNPHRLSSQFHPFSYNDVNAAAAVAAFVQPPSSSYSQGALNSALPANNTMTQLNTASTNIHHAELARSTLKDNSPENNENKNLTMKMKSTDHRETTRFSTASVYTNSSDDTCLDAPLNLSKH